MDKSASWNNEINVTNPNLFPQRSRRATQMRSRRLYITQPAEKTRASYLEGGGVASGKFSLTMRKPRKLNGIFDRNSTKMNVSVWNVGCMIMKRHRKLEESNEQSMFLWFTIAGLKKWGETTVNSEVVFFPGGIWSVQPKNVASWFQVPLSTPNQGWIRDSSWKQCCPPENIPKNSPITLR